MIACGAVTLIVTAAIVAVILFDINSFKSKIETIASDATGLDARINGKVELSFMPFGLSAKDIYFANRTGVILSLERLNIGTELIPLLRKQLRVTTCELVKPTFTIVKDAKGRFNFESIEEKSTKERWRAAFSLSELKLSKGTLVYLDRKMDEKTELKEINLAVKDLSVANILWDITTDVSFTGTMVCKELWK